MILSFRPTTLADIAALPAIERVAGQRFLLIPELAWLAGDDVIPIERHRQGVEQAMSWLALADDVPVAFLLAEALGSSLFIAEASVHLAWQGKGIGRRLILYVAEQARNKGFAAMTLTTFRNVPWNAPFYAHLGFELLPDAQLPEALRQKREEEAAHGLAYESRCAMRLTLL